MTAAHHLTFDLREAMVDDEDRLKALLSPNQQLAQDVLAPGARYWLAEDEQGNAIGTVGLEFGRGVALLRSAAVLPTWRGQGIGAALVRRALDAAATDECQRIYLFSTGAGPYWARFGFCQVPVAELVAALPDAPQVGEYERLGWLPSEVAWRLDSPIGV